MKLDNEKKITNIIELLEDERTFYEIAADAISYIEETVRTSHAYLVQRGIGAESNILIKYDRDDKYGDFLKIDSRQLKICDDNANVYYKSDNIYNDELELLDANVVVTVPIKLSGMPFLHLLIMDNGSKVFSESELGYIFDASLILSEIATKKIYRKSVDSTNGVLKQILTNVGSGILVFSLKNNYILFSNAIAEQSEEHIRVLNAATRMIMNDPEKLIPKRVKEFFDSESGLWFDVFFSKLTWVDGSEAVLLTSTDMTLKKKNSTKITFQAQNDFLTGLYNRMKCEIDLKKVIDKAVRFNTKGAVLFLDLDNFKNINDSLGHNYGDALLQEIGASIQGITGVRNHFYRMGGDEFVIVITPENYGLMNKIIKNIVTEFNKPWYLIDSECYCTMSMGIVEFPTHGCEVNTLIQKADIAMYEAKRAGKNGFKIYEEIENTTEGYHRLEVERNMRQAVESNCEEFLVYFQPIVNTDNDKCEGCESLVRWDSKALGFVGPGEFVPLAEYLGLINDIGDYVLETACYQCKEWNEKYDPHFTINVNLSVVQLLQRNVIPHITSIIRDTGVNPANITLEITENLAINDMDRVKEIVAGLKEFGVSIALDDFGTGYSSLNYIKELDFDIIKIDKSFIDDVVVDDYEQAFVKLIVDLAKKIDAKVCVEGIEDKEQYEMLKKMNASSIQGYYFGKPMPAREFEERFFKNEC